MNKCPKCGGTTGYEGTMTETHSMFGFWGQSPEAGSSGNNVKWSLMACVDCGAKFRLQTCEGSNPQTALTIGPQ